VGVLSPVFRKKKGDQRALSVLAISQVPLAQSNLYAKVAYFGVPYSVILQITVTGEHILFTHIVSK